MISHQSPSAPITGYFEYLSQIRQRVNVAPHESSDSEETTTATTTTTTTTTITPPPDTSVMSNNNTVFETNSSSTDNLQQQPLNLNDKDVTKWSSAEVQQWVEEQCQKFELKKATTEQFQMNGQALVLLTKHDFLRRSPDGGEILYYALQRLINPKKNNSIRVSQNFTRNGSWRQTARIVELSSDTDEHNSSAGSPPSSKPIVEEPDDPPLYRKSDSDTLHDNHQHQYYPHSFFYNNSHIRQPMFSMPSAAYYHQQQAYPNAYMYAHHHPHHVHPHMPQQQFFHSHQHPHFIHQYHQTMSAQGILIEEIDHEEAKNLTTNGGTSSPNETATNGASSDPQVPLYLVTINGQRYVMNEEQVAQYVGEVQRLQQQQQQQRFHQQQQFHQQQPHQQQQHQQQQPQQPHQPHQPHQPQQPHQQHQQQPFHQHPQQQYTYQPQQHQPSQDNIFHTT